ncbi:RluA family pseudouridine synthase [Coprobacter tertius]|uniref:Pseudouridine synthase n=1 Tax=Coprobacter tertius TaxID=2944915 RepID=A0ABT1MFB6_9BACT|nr:RluA family pseudouridine synthase [Coprobacter tertius]MCP9611039.1 RluA family pseudouridine synthase [Coprobacter tertius]
MRQPHKHKTRGEKKNNALKEYKVEEDGTLLAYLYGLLCDKSKTTVKSYLSHRQVAVNDTPITQFDFPVHKGDIVVVNFEKGFSEFKHPRLRIVYEDQFLIVIDKGYGLLSMSTDRIKTKTAYRIISDYLKENDPGARLFILHRLDRDTSGLMMFAKNKEIQEQMQKAWNDMVIDRRYVAVVEGIPEPGEGQVSSWLKENAAFEVYSSDDKEGGEYALTRYKVLQNNKNFALVELQLATGRKNQIRVHMKDIGHSIIGDKKYGSKCNPIRRLALHASRLRFVHPITRRDMFFETPVPRDFRFIVK